MREKWARARLDKWTAVHEHPTDLCDFVCVGSLHLQILVESPAASKTRRRIFACQIITLRIRPETRWTMGKSTRSENALLQRY